MPKRHRQGERALSEEDAGRGESYSPYADSEIIPSIKREFLLTPLTDDTFRDVARLFSKAIGTSLTNSHLFRVLLKAVGHAMPELEREVLQVGKLRRPSNARAYLAEREEFERRLAATVVAALRRSPPFNLDAADSRQGRGSGKRSA